MIRFLKTNKIVQIITAALTFAAALLGLVQPQMYAPVIVLERVIPGVFTQDLLAAGGSLVMIVLALTMGANDIRKATVNLGLFGFFFYAYGIYAIEQVYTFIYPLYLAILALSFYGLIFGLASIEISEVERLRQPAWMRTSAAIYGIFIAVMFNIIWLIQLIPYLQAANRIENTFSVFIIDLVFIMPGFLIAAILALRKHGLGIIGLPALFVLGFGILSPLAIAELIKPVRYGLPMIPGELGLFGTLASIFLVLAIVYLGLLRDIETNSKSNSPVM
jgi:hypothetical protein